MDGDSMSHKSLNLGSPLSERSLSKQRLPGFVSILSIEEPPMPREEDDPYPHVPEGKDPKNEGAKSKSKAKKKKPEPAGSGVFAMLELFEKDPD
jgi:hypothetical protein